MSMMEEAAISPEPGSALSCRLDQRARATTHTVCHNRHQDTAPAARCEQFPSQVKCCSCLAEL